MRRLPKITGRFLGVLLAAVLALAPALTFADTALALDKAAHAAASSDDAPPCDAPCDGCADQGDGGSAACKMGCNGIATPALAHDVIGHRTIVIEKAAITYADRLADRRREPDKPPPKTILA